jgi:mannose/cellobiose epimerase-like protein (N-acyl-D-glucosamine 2-epimerase family)
MTSATRTAALGWLCNDALPFWHQVGWDPHSGGFVERLTPSGEPDLAAPRRVRVQMRQVYVYACAAHDRRYELAAAVALETLRFLLERCRPPNGGPGFVHLTDSEGAIIDRRIDAYDQAFGLLALAAAFRMTGDAQIRALIDAELAFIDAELVDPTTGLWLEGLPPSLPRRQNPQMHAFEAFLALYEATGDAGMLARADRIAAHLEERMVSSSGAVCEYFDAGFVPLADGQVVEPGHHFEWVWLLHRHARLAGRPVSSAAARLHAWGMRYGLDKDGFAIDACWPDGTIKDAGRRLWPQTELAKALLSQQEAGTPGTSAQADDVLAALMATYISKSPRGGWVDRYDASGALSDARMPVSTFYHVYVAIAEAARVGGLNG